MGLAVLRYEGMNVLSCKKLTLLLLFVTQSCFLSYAGTYYWYGEIKLWCDDTTWEASVIPKYEDNYSSVTIPSSVKAGNYIKEFTVTLIDNDAFLNATTMSSVSIPETLRTIGNNAFKGCTGLTSIIIPEGVTSIGNNVFDGCTGLMSVTLPSTLENIGSECFKNCSKLASIIIPEKVNSIGKGAFSGCTGLTSIMSRLETPINIASDVFDTSVEKAVTLQVPDGCVSIYRQTNYWNEFLSIDDDVVTITANSLKMLYGDQLPELTYESSGPVLRGYPSISCTATSTSPVGEYDIIVTRGSIANENVHCVNGKMTIEQAPLQAYTGVYKRKEGEENPNFTISYNGWRNNEGTYVLQQKPQISCRADASSPKGKYPINTFGGKAQNYKIIHSGGFLIITDNVESPKGDVDGNGKVDVNDVLVLHMMVSGAMGAWNFEEADINNDGKITVADADMLLGKYVLNRQ